MRDKTKLIAFADVPQRNVELFLEYDYEKNQHYIWFQREPKNGKLFGEYYKAFLPKNLSRAISGSNFTN